MPRPESSVRPPRLRAYRSSDGLEILVGRDAGSNDELSCGVAAPDDFWLHVAGTEGSHVVVRNPEGLPALPKATLREAAALAAYHSKARGAGAVTVHVTRARHVRKPRGAPAGLVELSRFTATRARPEVPATVEALP